jgi:hypothetical protein
MKMGFPTIVDSSVPGTRKNVNTSGLNSKSTRDCRLTAGERVKIRVAAPVGLTTGAIRESGKRPSQRNCHSNKELRVLAIKVLRSRGIAATDNAISGILSGRTL